MEYDENHEKLEEVEYDVKIGEKRSMNDIKRGLSSSVRRQFKKLVSTRTRGFESRPPRSYDITSLFYGRTI